jgi:hypothetical protein
MLVWLTSDVAFATMCVLMGDDTDALLPSAERVYRGRAVEIWTSNEFFGDCAEYSPLGSYSLYETDDCVVSQGFVRFEVLDVWKGPAEEYVELQLSWPRTLQLGWTGVIFQRGDYDIADCGWSGWPSLGPPRASFEETWRVEDFLWQAVADDDLEGVRNALAYGPHLDGHHYLEQALSMTCPPPAYDELIRTGMRSVDGISRCSTERVLPLLGVVSPGDPAWEEVAVRADVSLLQRLEAVGVPVGKLADRGLFEAWGRAPEMAWWLARGASPADDKLPLDAPFTEDVYAVLADAGVRPTCPYTWWDFILRAEEIYR